MATGSSDPLPRLADALREVGSRLHEISDELRGLSLGSATTNPTETTTPVPEPAFSRPPEPVPTRQPMPEPPLRWQPPPLAATPPVPPPSPTFPQWPRPPEPRLVPEPPSLWERITRDGAGSRILAWAGGVVTLAGVVLLLVLAIQRGYLGPLPRVLLGAGLGLALLGIGMRLHPNPNARTGAFALAATGIAGLYLDVIAATTLHHFLPPFAGLLVGLAVAGAGIALAGRWDSQLFATFVVVCCAVCAPILTNGFVPLLLGFLLVLEVAATPVQFARRWDGLCLVAGLPPVIATMISVGLAKNGGFGIESASTAVLALAISAVQIALATAAAARRPADDFPLALLLIAPAPTMLAAILVPKLPAAVLPGTIAVLLITVWVLERTNALNVPRRFAMAAGAAGSVAAFQATATGLGGSARAIVLLGEALVVALIALRLRYPAALFSAGLFGLAGLGLTLAVAMPPRMLVEAPTRDIPVGTAAAAGLTGLLLAAAAMVVCWTALRLELFGGRDNALAGWFWTGLVALYGASGAMLSVGLLVLPDRSGFLLGHVLVTVSWTVGALALLLRGIDWMQLRVAGLALVAAALVKLVLFDLSSLDGIARVAAFLVAGLVLLAAGVRYARLVSGRQASSDRV